MTRKNTGILHSINPEIDRTYHRLVRQNRTLDTNFVSVSEHPVAENTASEHSVSVHSSSDPRLSERFSPERERITWEGEILDYTGRFSPERELPRLCEKWQIGAVDTVRFSLEREYLA
ncbi:hypothetical protein Lal_00028236 [Lupinus albus]|nr:hypothetical protein Lal_00028236 [Lupinus albus]